MLGDTISSLLQPIQKDQWSALDSEEKRNSTAAFERYRACLGDARITYRDFMIALECFRETQREYVL